MVSIARWPALDALHDASFRRLWLAGLCVNVGRWLDFLVLGWLVLDLTGSPFMVGLAAFCRFAPMIVLGLFAGLFIDRLPRGRMLVGVQSVNFGVMVLLAILFALDRGSLWVLIGLEMVLGIAWADFPSRRTVLFTLVGSKRITNAISLESVSMQGTKIIGPVLGGVLLARLGPVACYVVLAVLFLAALLLTLSLTRRIALPAATPSGESILAGLAAGFQEARWQPAILGVLIITVVMNGLVFPYQQIMPVFFARDILDVGPELLGLLIAAGGVGTLIGALWTAGRRDFVSHRQVFVGGSMLAGLMVVIQSFSPTYLMALPIQFIIGIAESGFGTMQSTIVLLASHERARGRVLGILSVCIGTNPLGALAVGFITTYVGAPVAFGASAALALILMAPFAARLLADGTRPLRVIREEQPA